MPPILDIPKGFRGTVIELIKGVSGKKTYYWFRALSSNREIVLGSETYTKPSDARRAATRFLKAIKDKPLIIVDHTKP